MLLQAVSSTMMEMKFGKYVLKNKQFFEALRKQKSTIFRFFFLNF